MSLGPKPLALIAAIAILTAGLTLTAPGHRVLGKLGFTAACSGDSCDYQLGGLDESDPISPVIASERSDVAIHRWQRPRSMFSLDRDASLAMTRDMAASGAFGVMLNRFEDDNL